MSFKRLNDCENCMLEGEKIVTSAGEPKNKICLISEMPSKHDYKNGAALSDSSGYMMSENLSRVGISRYETYTMNFIQCRTPGGYNTNPEFQSACECCSKGFEEELKWLGSREVKVLMPLGDQVLKYLGIDEKLLVARGSVYYRDPFIIIPTYSPLFINKQKQETITWLNDFNKALEYTTKDYKPPKESFNINPSIEDIKTFTEKVTSEKLLVAIDTETTKLDPQLGQIVVTGMAIDGENCISFPKYNKNGYEYWNNGDKDVVTDCLQKILLECPLAFQNAMYDCYWFMEKGFKIGQVKHDTMLLHALINPELKHNLEYINSIYGIGPAWKSEYSSHKIPILSKDENLVRTYNSRDCVVLHQCLPAMIKDGKNIMHIYENISLKLIKPLLEMQLTGLRVDKRALNKWKKSLKDEIAELEYAMRELAKLPEDFNLNSIQHLCILLYNKKPGWVSKGIKELAEYDKRDSKKRKDTKKYRNLLGKIKFVADIIPFTFPKGLVPKRTTGNAYSTDDEAITRYKLAAIKRLEAVRSLKRYLPTHVIEEDGLIIGVQFMKLLKTYKGLVKLYDAYTQFSIMPDGKVHGKFKIHGTATGRLSSGEDKEKKNSFMDKNKNLNVQTIPKVAKKVFVPEEGHVFLQADYKNLELVVLGEIADDKVIQETFAKGLNIHDIETEKLFNITKDSSEWDLYRRIEKKKIFGGNYGASLVNQYKRIALEIDDFNMSFSDFKKMDMRFHMDHPAIGKWQEDVKREVTAKRELTNIFGRKRIFLGRLNNVLREALNFPIQSVAGDIMSKGLIAVYENRDECPPFKMTLTVHDSLVVQCLEEDVKEVSNYLKKYLEQEHDINDKKVRFPVEVEVGNNYKDMIDLEEYLKWTL